MQLPDPVPDNYVVSWAAFCKENLPERSFTLWEWFYAALKVIKDYLKGPWCDGYINGFVSKAKVEAYLQNSVHGAFILRFSDSELGL